ncbi:hypothetical protein ACOSQ4_016799 [Xanthoceras sorbifolium]
MWEGDLGSRLLLVCSDPENQQVPRRPAATWGRAICSREEEKTEAVCSARLESDLGSYLSLARAEAVQSSRSCDLQP